VVRRLAAIDCGTNSIRLLIADAKDGKLRDVHRETRIVRLGQGVDATGQFAPDALERTRAALADYAALLRTHNVERVRMVATSAARDVANRDVFFTMTADVLAANWTVHEVLSSSSTWAAARRRSWSAGGQLETE
jgi:exopolyphosphatase / guanosine-5'-triphosphate,3'-diphosphate pyrophosphatase